MNSNKRSLAVITTGGDVPGLNACLRALVKYGTRRHIHIKGVLNGYEGLINGQWKELRNPDVEHIISQGGTILGSARSKRFMTEEGRRDAYAQYQKMNVNGLVVIGGDGSMAGARLFSQEYQVPVIGIPKTIDNDIEGTDFAIGYDTALNTAMEAIDRIRDTADSHHRVFLVEVMGRSAGYIALRTGIASGAEAVMLPEIEIDRKHLFHVLEAKWKKGKRSLLVVMAEGDEPGGAAHLAEILKKQYPQYDIGTVTLGHIQRGGSPSCTDRVLASRLGVAAIDAFEQGLSGVLIGEIKGEIAYTPLEKAVKRSIPANDPLLRIQEVLWE